MARRFASLPHRALSSVTVAAAATNSRQHTSDPSMLVAAAAAAASGVVGCLLYNRFTPAKCHGASDGAALGERITKLENELGGRLARIEAALFKLTNESHVAASTTGQGDAVFSWDEQLTGCMPSEVRKFEDGMHGGFNEDPETGIVYTGIPGYGLCSISPDLTMWKKLGSDPVLKGNIHGIVYFQHKGEKLLAIALNNDQKIAVVTIDGEVKQVIERPKGGEFDFSEANNYYGQFKKDAEKIFSCTDVTFLEGKIYVVTGYCPGDFVLTLEETDGQWQWGKTAWGGKGTEPGKFQTAHGVTAFEGHIYVSNREAHQVNKFTPDGKLVEILPGIPAGSRICNVSRATHDDRWYMNALAPVTPDQPTAPIYAYTDRVVSTIIPGELGIPVLKHIHQCWPHYVRLPNGKRQLYLLVHGWNHGKFAVLKHED